MLALYPLEHKGLCCVYLSPVSLGFNASLMKSSKAPFGINLYTLSKEIHKGKTCVQVWLMIDRLIGS